MTICQASPSGSRLRVAIAVAVATAALLLAAPAPPVADAQCADAAYCGDIVGQGDGVKASDALALLRCAVGQPVALDCAPGSTTTTTTTTTTTLGPTTTTTEEPAGGSKLVCTCFCGSFVQRMACTPCTVETRVADCQAFCPTQCGGGTAVDGNSTCFVSDPACPAP